MGDHLRELLGKKFRFPLNIQYFAEPGEPGGTNEPDKKEPGKDESGKQQLKTYSEEELTAIIDKVVAKTIAKERSKWEEELAKKEKEKEEEKEMAKMSAEQRAQAEFKKEKEKFEKEKAQWERERLLAEAKDTLSDLGLSREFAKYLLAEDKEKTLANINEFEKEFNKAVQAKVDELFKNGGRDIDYKKYDVKSNTNPFMPGEHYNLTEQGRLWKEDPARAKALMDAAKKKTSY